MLKISMLTLIGDIEDLYVNIDFDIDIMLFQYY